MVSRDSLLEQFQILGCAVEDNDVLDKCVELCSELGKNEEDFVESWVAFSASNYGDFDPTLNRLEEMHIYENSQKVEIRKENETFNNATGTNNQTNFEDDDDLMKLYGVKSESTTEIKRSASPEPIPLPEETIKQLPDSPKQASKSYKDSGKILLTFGKSLSSWKSALRTKTVVQKGEQNHINKDASYGFELLPDKVKTLQSINRVVGQELCTVWHSAEKKDICYTSFANIKCQKPVRTWGRVHYEKSSGGQGTIYLKGSTTPIDQKEGPIERLENYIEMNMTKIPSYSLYSGQILAVEATNPTGSTLVVSQIFDGPILKRTQKNPLKQTLRLAVASGPFSTLDNLHCDPLWDLVEKVVEDEPNVLILGGPFIESSHPQLKQYKTMTFQEHFAAIVTKLMDKLEGKSTQVVIVSSHRDIHHDPVYPTPEYSISKSFKNLHFMPDPCTMDVDGLSISMTTVDSIMHLGRKEIVCKPKNTDKLSRLANYILSQGFFYPLYPPAKEITLDTVLWQKHAYMESSPHLLILPSDMRHFCKPINGTVVVNPERLSKRTYAKIEVRPSNNSWPHDQVSCEILKL